MLIAITTSTMLYHSLTFLSVVATSPLNILAGLKEDLKQGMAEEAKAIRHESSEGHKTTRKDFAEKIDALRDDLSQKIDALSQKVDAKVDALSQKIDASNKQLNDAITNLLGVVHDVRKLATQN